MKNILRVLKRDILRLFKAPAALVVVAFLIVLPSLYTWFNVIGFWNPYENTGNLRVCVVNEDTGVDTEVAGRLDIGDQIVAELQSNTQLGWVFTDRQSAMKEVESGESYATFVIPENFSSDLATLLTGDFHQPQLEYYVNEKMGAVSPKITDSGASTLEETINGSFVSTMSDVIAQQIDERIAKSNAETASANSAITLQFDKVKSTIKDTRDLLGVLSETTTTATNEANNAKGALEDAKGEIGSVGNQLQEVSDLTELTRNDLMTFSNSFLSTMNRTSIFTSQVATKTNTAVGSASKGVEGAQVQIHEALEEGRTVAKSNETVIAELSALQSSMPDSPEKTSLGQIVVQLGQRNGELEASIDDLQKVSDDTTAASIAISTATDQVTVDTLKALSIADGYRTVVATETLPQVNAGLYGMTKATADLSAAVSDQVLLAQQTQGVLNQLTSTLQNTSTAICQTDALLAQLNGDLENVETDLVALSTATSLSQLFDGHTIDRTKVADFMKSPTQVRTESLYALNAYGSAMAPLFMNLTLWIGVFMLMVILKQEVDDEDIENLSIAQRFVARWLFLAPIVALQAIVCCIGVLVIGVQTENVALFFLTAIVASLTYLSIQYTLSVTLQHIGKGICVVLVFVQIPSATGLYPIEMTPDFFQTIYPLFPFTYGINAMRETIAGFYGNTWALLMFILVMFMVAFFVVGLLLRPLFTNVNRMFARQVKSSDILNGEAVHLPARRYRLKQLFQLLSDREEFRENLQVHVDRFVKWYPRLRHAAGIFGVAVPVVVTAILLGVGVEKVIVLSVWLLWLIFVILCLVLIEHLRNNLERQLKLEELSDDEVRRLVQLRNKIAPETASSAAGEVSGRE